MDQIKIGAFISMIRKEAGMTQEKLGEKLGVTQKTISRWETGKNMPDISMLPVICDTLDINIAELMNGERIEGESITKADTSTMARELIYMATQKKNIKKIIGAVLSVVITFACMVGLYHNVFNINVDSTSDLEAAINSYHFNEEISSDVLERAALGNDLYVLYGQNGYPGASGLARLEKGIFGQYRIIRCTDVDYPLIFVSKTTSEGKDYAITFCVNELPDVKSYAIYGYDQSNTGRNITVDDEGELLFSYEYGGSPFLTLTELAGNFSLSPYGTKYFNESGNEINAKTLEGMFEIDENAGNSGYGTAELGMLYFFEAVILILGLVFIRYFLSDVVKVRKR